LSEIEFLTLHGAKSGTVVYAGAAPGTHIKLLSDMFPNHKFILVDPAPFVCKPIPGKIEITQDFFTDSTAKSFAGKNVLFISDIRTADPNAMEEEDVEDTIESDQVMQMEWHKMMEPACSILKFRLPWGKGTTRYLDGDIFLPIWGRQSTTETRLMCTTSKCRDYDHTEYENQMFYFNTITRVHYYHHEVKHVPGLCHCYDCAAEVYVLSKYFVLKALREDENTDVVTPEFKQKLNETVSDFSVRLNSECSTSNRTLSEIIGHGQKWFEPKKYDIDNRQIVRVNKDEVVKVKKSYPESYERAPRAKAMVTLDDGDKSLKIELPVNKKVQELMDHYTSQTNVSSRNLDLIYGEKVLSLSAILHEVIRNDDNVSFRVVKRPSSSSSSSSSSSPSSSAEKEKRSDS
jgi:hypothetical protein